ncbi:hypothetical protein [Actinomadura kijaniata]|uniref:hypothetical protein n=1 Tax=Actinomadura kijaniata TaxID=46161 RepID=UPI000834CDBA|nr:hypothetical protein [Actinomadura kijaniata]
MNGDEPLVHRVLLAVDIQGYGQRDTRQQLETQRQLNRLLDEAAATAGLDRALWRKQVGGDGELSVLPGETDPASVGDLVLALEAGLETLNRSRPLRLRLRLALHHGPLAEGPFGPSGDAPVVVQRLLDAGPLRRLLADDPGRDLAVVVSDSLYADVIRTGFSALPPNGFQPIRITAKGTVFQGHLLVRDPSTSRPGPWGPRPR